MACRLILVLANSLVGTGLMPDGGEAWDPSRLPGYGTGGLGSNIQVLFSQQTDHCNLSTGGLSASENSRFSSVESFYSWRS